MVLRKQPPPRLNSVKEPNHRLSISPTAKSASPVSPKRLTRPRRAQSSPYPRRLPSQDSIYSPDLHTSPAFDLMTLEQAQRSPVGTAHSEAQNPWADELVEKPGQQHQEYPSGSTPASHNGIQEEPVNKNKGDRVPSILVAGTQRRMAANEWQPEEEADEWEHVRQTPTQLRSNNPFLKTRQSEGNPWQTELYQTQQAEDTRASQATSLHSDALSQGEGIIPMTARLSLLDQQPSDSAWAEEHPVTASQPQHPQNGHYVQEPQAQIPNYMADGQSYDTHGAPGNAAEHEYQPQYTSPFEYQPYPTQTSQDYDEQIPQYQPNTASDPISSATTQSSNVLVDFDSSKPEVPPRSTSSVYESDLNEARGTRTGSSETAPPLPQRPDRSEGTEQHTTSAADANRQAEQRAETYTIRHVNWTDITGKLRNSPILSQNENGPCPLLALVNALVISSAEDAQTPVVKALQTREQISLGLLIQALFEELIMYLGPDDEFPDIEALSQFLTMLHTGMNVNPRLTLEPEDNAGRFYETSDIQFYNTFGLPLVHGWVANPSTEAHAAFSREAQYYEDIQLLPFRKEELEDQVFRGGSLTPEEEQSMHDIQTIQQFVEVDHATQLSDFGLEHLKARLTPGSVSILFRNDHFTTLYKHPQTHQLFTIVTDAGYASHAEIVWENLVDVNGSRAEFFSGDFRPVGHGPSGAPATSAPALPSRDAGHSTGSKDEPSQEQADADYAYALALQFQEEEQQRQNSAGHNRNASAPNQPARGHGPEATHQRTSSVVNRGTGRYQPAAEQRSARSSQQHGQSSHSREDDDLPSYAQAARSPVYSPQQSTPSVNPSNPSNWSNPSMDSRFSRSHHGLGRRPPATSSGPPERPKDKNKDCIVM